MKAKKSFGQNWLKDQYALDTIVQSADISKSDTILEVGPGLGYLTEKLLSTGARVIAVESDKDLIYPLKQKFLSDQNIRIVISDILKFNLKEIPVNYKVVANIPYYLTSNLIRMFLDSENKPHTMVLLVQKEVAQRIIAGPGQMSVLAFSVQYYAQAELVADVSRELFEPVPNVDSSIVRFVIRDKPRFDADSKQLFRIVKAGFSNKRKMLKNSLSSALRIDQVAIVDVLDKCQISQNSRAQELDFEQWHGLYLQIRPMLK
ncbi:MAG: rRNA (adenine1518-N6/adenine1519-N6)-dimethyltransferase [Patescibacteria group bacterium]|nr:rRNA (adenine1518-N6/adenine1519-N6)-dimethyltransferase [Patescibacteria group bacterium]